MSGQITFQFISEPQDVNFGGNVHGGEVMKWIDQAAYACATGYAENYCVTVYVGGIRFYKPIAIGDLVKIKARVIYTGRTSIHISCDVYSRNLKSGTFHKTSHCVVVFVSVDRENNPVPVRKFVPKSQDEKDLYQYAVKLMELRKGVSEEMEKVFAKDKSD